MPRGVYRGRISRTVLPESIRACEVTDEKLADVLNNTKDTTIDREIYFVVDMQIPRSDLGADVITVHTSDSEWL